MQALETYEAQLSMFGYEIEPFGGKEYAITAIPADFTDIDMKTMFIEMLDDFCQYFRQRRTESDYGKSGVYVL